MKQPLLAIGILFTGYFCSAQQNLVPNNSFETYSYCPIFADAVENASPWYDPTNMSSDYFNACVTAANFVGIPNNAFGHQFASSGNAYCGFAISFQGDTGIEYHIREYISAPLFNSLIGGQKYIVEFYVSLSDYSLYAANKIGAYFSQNKIDSTSTVPHYLAFNPQIEHDYMVRDTVNWILLSDTFTALGGEQYITLGNFRTNYTTSNDTIQPWIYPPVLGYMGYYYIDDVSVYCVDSGYTTADAGTNQIICAGDSAQLGTSAQSGLTYSWSPTYGMDPVAGLDSAGATMAQPWAKPQKTTTYILTVVDTVSSCKGPGRDSITVTVVDTRVCSVGIKEFKVENLKFKVYPNPSGKEATLHYNLSYNAQGAMEIINVLGVRVALYNLESTKRELAINTGNMENGMYFCRVKVNDKVVYSDKLVVIH